MGNRLVGLVLAGSLVVGTGCVGENGAEEEAIEVATTASGLACIAWTPVQTGSVTIGDNQFAFVQDGNFSAPYQVGDGYAIKIVHGTCTPEEVKIYAKLVVGGPDVELSPLRFVQMPDGSKIWIYKPNTASEAFNLTSKIKGNPGDVCGFMTMTCTTGL
jgi:hypothetical protein